MPYSERKSMKIASNLSLERRIARQEQIIRDLARQHQQISENHAELLDMILQLQLQLIDLEQQLLAGR